MFWALSVVLLSALLLVGLLLLSLEPSELLVVVLPVMLLERVFMVGFSKTIRLQKLYEYSSIFIIFLRHDLAVFVLETPPEMGSNEK